MTTVQRSADEGLATFQRPAELVDISERLYRRIFAVGLWVAVACAVFAVGASFLQPAGSQLRGAIVSTACLFAITIAAKHPAWLYDALRRRPWLLLIPAAFMGLGALAIGRYNFQLFVPMVAIIGVPGIATGRRMVIVAGLIAAAGLGAPQVLRGHADLGPVIVMLVPPLMFWLIVDRIAGFALRLHQSLGDSASPAPGSSRGTFESHGCEPDPCSADPHQSAQPPALPQGAEGDVAGVKLTARQLQVIMLSCEGLEHADIGDCLGIEVASVRKHLKKARARTGSRSEPQLAAWAWRSGLVPHPSASQRDEL